MASIAEKGAVAKASLSRFVTKLAKTVFTKGRTVLAIVNLSNLSRSDLNIIKIPPPLAFFWGYAIIPKGGLNLKEELCYEPKRVTGPDYRPGPR